MKKISLIAALLLAVLLLQNCKKDVFTASTTSTEPMIALINDTTWVSDTIKAAVTYNSATNTKVFTCTGISNNKQINLYATQLYAGNTPGFALSTYNVNANSNVAMSYEYPQLNLSGQLVLMPQGTVAPGSGTIVVTAIDSVKKQITGTFSFNSIKNNYDTNGNIVSVTVASITSGGFNNVPYTFTSN